MSTVILPGSGHDVRVDVVDISRRVSLTRRAVAIAVGVALCCLGLLASASSARAGTRVVASARSAVGPGIWGAAQEVPGMASLNQGEFGALLSVSCASASSCAGGGYYLDSSSNLQAFVVNRTDGIWGAAEEVPGSAALNTIYASTVSVSCASAGNCGAGGFYTSTDGNVQAFVVNEADGAWGAAEEVPGTGALNAGGFAQINSVSCASAGNCSAGGDYYETHVANTQEAFVVTETNGSWGTAQEVPGTAALNQGGSADILSVSCASAGNCSAGGYYTDGLGKLQAFVVDETNGIWGNAQNVHKGSSAQINSVSCVSVGNCSAGGSYVDSAGRTQALVVSKTGHTWGPAQEVPGSAALNAGGHAALLSVSCASPGNCNAGGSYVDSAGKTQALVVSKTGHTWGPAQEVPGSAALNAGGDAALLSVSCASPGICSAGGAYVDASGQTQALVVSKTGHTWDPAQEVPGSAALNAGGDAGVLSVSCASPGNCAAGGLYKLIRGSNAFQAFVVNETTRP